LVYIAALLIAPLRLVAWVVNKLADAIYDIKKGYRDELEQAIGEDVKKASRISGLKRADLLRISPAIYDASKCYRSIEWWPRFRKVLRNHPGRSGIDPPRDRTQIGTGDAVFGFLFFGFIAVLMGFALISIITSAVPTTPNLNGLMAYDLEGVACVWFILSFIRAVVHRYLPYNYITFALFVEYLLAILVIHTYPAWSPAVANAWQSLHQSVPFKYRVLLPHIQPGRVILVAVWITAVECLIRVVIRIVRYLGRQISILCLRRNRLPTYGGGAEQSAALVILFLQVSYSLSEWELNLPSDTALDLKAIGARIPPSAVRDRTDRNLVRLAWTFSRPWKDAMRSSILTPGRRSAGGRLAHEASRIEYFLQCQRVKIMLGGANFIRLREEMTTALVQSADGNWHLIGRGEEYEIGSIAGRWKTVVRRLIAIAIPIALAIGISEFARKIPAPYIQAVILTCLGFAAVQLLGLIDPEAPARLDIASKVSGIFRR
jgi:hypothetical protein